MVTVEFDSMGEAVRLALVADEYVGGGLAVLLLLGASVLAVMEAVLVRIAAAN